MSRAAASRSIVSFVSAVAVGAFLCGSSARAQTIVFDFDNAPVHTSLPVDVTVAGVTAHLVGTNQNFSIQPANTMGFTPAGFSGLCIYPNSVFAADLVISFSVPLTSFSILYAPQELDCDTSCTMRVTARMDGAAVATNTATTNPGVWPTGTLAIATATPFNSVVVHYDSPPPTGGDWGPIFLADMMTVTTFPHASWSNYGAGWPGTNGVPTLALNAPPALGGSTSLAVGNSRGAATTGVLVMGFGQGDFLLGLGGHLLVVPTTSVALTIPPAGLALPAALPLNGALAGTAVELQLLEIDPGASQGVAFSRGLEAVLGS